MIIARLREAIAPVLILVIGGGAIATAWGFQLIGGYVPCALCLEQRIPYYVGLPIALLALLAALAGSRALVVRALLVITGLVFAYGAYLGAYHAGAEWGWWLGPADCGGGTSQVTDVNDLLGQLDSVRLVSCTEASWRFLGLSFAGWNVVGSVLLVAIAIWGAFRPLAAGEKAETSPVGVAQE